MKKLALILMIIFLSSCGYPPEDEISRLPSPDNTVEVVVTNHGEVHFLGATVTGVPPTYIYIVPSGQAIQEQYRVLAANAFQIKSLSWTGPERLTISYYAGEINLFRNTWQYINNRKIRIYLNDTNQPD